MANFWGFHNFSESNAKPSISTFLSESYLTSEQVNAWRMLSEKRRFSFTYNLNLATFSFNNVVSNSISRSLSVPAFRNKLLLFSVAFLISFFSASLFRTAFPCCWQPNTYILQICVSFFRSTFTLARSTHRTSALLRAGELLSCTCHTAATNWATLSRTTSLVANAWQCTHINSATIRYDSVHRAWSEWACRFWILPNVKQRKLLYFHRLSTHTQPKGEGDICTRKFPQIRQFRYYFVVRMQFVLAFAT